MSDLATTLKIPQPEQIIAGRYRIVSRLGSGGMGLVFLAEQLNVGNRVALKFLDPEPSGDDSRVARFLREAKVAIEVQHPGAAQVLDLGRDEANRLFLCFELVEGEDLRELIKREGRLTFSESRDIALQVAAVLAHAHDRGIVHRDVKPENLRVRRDLVGVHVKVLDFGIARLLKDAGVRLTAEGMLAGTPRYMSPEQVKDEPITPAVDQYALGLVLFEMLTGAVAMGGKNISQILLHQLQTLVPPLAWVDPQLASPEVDTFIARACAKESHARFPSMADFITALKAVRVDERSWPAPRPPPAQQGSTTAPTRDGNAPPVDPALADTFVRVPEATQMERRQEVPTDPWRAPVEKKTPHAPDERPTEPARKSSSRPEAPAAPPLPVEGLEMPTDPERPAVVRRAATASGRLVRETVRGTQPPAPARRSVAAWLTATLVALAGIGAAAWWYVHR